GQAPSLQNQNQEIGSSAPPRLRSEVLPLASQQPGQPYDLRPKTYDQTSQQPAAHHPSGADTRWFRPGDKYYQDSDGYLWFAGRSGDLFKVSGSWVSPAEVESALARHPAVRECAVVARADKDNLLRPAAFVVCSADFPGATCPDHAALERDL